MRGIFRQVVVLAGAVIMVVALFLVSTNNPDFAGSGPDRTSQTIYDRFPTAISPAPFTFAIWLPIFLGSLALSVYQALPKQRNDRRLDAVALPLVAAFLLNALTGFVPIGASVLVIVALLIALAWAFGVLTQFEIGERNFDLFVRTPIVIFFAWITVATIVNISQWLVSLEWSGFGISAPLWSALLILIASGVGVTLVRRVKGISLYALVLIWAFVGIVAVDPSRLPVLIASVIGALALLWAAFKAPGGTRTTALDAS
jgi:hypothetical protein